MVALPEVLLGQDRYFGLIFNGHLALGRWLFRFSKQGMQN